MDRAVSLKEVAAIINRQRFGIHKISMGIIKEKLEALPPVTPTCKVGKWIPHQIQFDADYGIEDVEFECDQCHEMIDIETPFCPNCGADMRGGEQ